MWKSTFRGSHFSPFCPGAGLPIRYGRGDDHYQDVHVPFFIAKSSLFRGAFFIIVVRPSISLLSYRELSLFHP